MSGRLVGEFREGREMMIRRREFFHRDRAAKAANALAALDPAGRIASALATPIS